MEGFEITGPYASALLMSLGAVCVFIWGVLSGAFHRADEASVRFCEMEMESDAKHRIRRPNRRVTIRVTKTKGRNMVAAPSRRGTAISRYGYWASTRCFSSGGSTTPTPIGAASVQGGSICRRHLKAEK